MGEKESVVHNFSDSKSLTISKSAIIFYVILLLLGFGTGFILVRINHSSSVDVKTTSGTVSETIQTGKMYGSSDTSKYTDSATGVLRNGGIDGEGAFHLERPGGASQNVYLTSDVVDLSPFVGKKIKIWGQTNKAQKAGWLMNVGIVQLQ